MIEWSKETLLSRYCSLIVFLVLVPIVAFYIGVLYQTANAEILRSAETREALAHKQPPLHTLATAPKRHGK